MKRPPRHLPALLAALGLAGCGVGDPRPCSISCGADGECPSGTECGPDLLCYAADEDPGSCATAGDAGIPPGEDAGRPDDPDAGLLDFAGESAPGLSIPDNLPSGIDDFIDADVAGLAIETVEVHIEIAHTWRGDMVLTLLSPGGETASVIEIPAEDSGVDVRGTFDVAGFTPGSSGTGEWTLRMVDRGPGDVGLL
ncbi:MAG TPA: proprotein convertase P-domain-containing protein, partial [Kofleriaceae bacterium]|nr:proprotein convertase P-domain-containing protein [Kofleriaceae bacterium]